MDSIAPIEQGGDEAQAGEDVAGELVVAGGDGTEILDAAVGALDHVTPFVALGIEREAALAIGFIGDNGNGAAVVEQGAQMIGIITPCLRRGRLLSAISQPLAAVACSNGAATVMSAMLPPVS